MDRVLVLQKLRVVLGHEPKQSPLVQALADYVVEPDPTRKKQISRRFYTRLSKELKTV